MYEVNVKETSVIKDALILHTQFDHGWGMLMILPNGLVVVESDWENGSYWWPAKGTGYPTTAEFLASFATRSCDYLTNKLFRKLPDVIDKKATCSNVEDVLRCNGRLMEADGAEDLEEAIEKIDGWPADWDESLLEELYACKVEPYELVVRKVAPAWEQMNNQVLPKLLQELRKHLDGVEEKRKTTFHIEEVAPGVRVITTSSK